MDNIDNNKYNNSNSNNNSNNNHHITKKTSLPQQSLSTSSFSSSGYRRLPVAQRPGALEDGWVAAESAGPQPCRPVAARLEELSGTARRIGGGW